MHELLWHGLHTQLKNPRLMNVLEQHVSRVIITFISEHNNGSNTHKFEMIKNTFIDNESFNSYEVFNTKYKEIRIQSIVFVTLRIPNNKTEVPLTKKIQTTLYSRYWFQIHLS